MHFRFFLNHYMRKLLSSPT